MARREMIRFPIIRATWAARAMNGPSPMQILFARVRFWLRAARNRGTIAWATLKTSANHRAR
jgi:hypothetical protein